MNGGIPHEEGIYPEADLGCGHRDGSAHMFKNHPLQISVTTDWWLPSPAHWKSQRSHTQELIIPQINMQWTFLLAQSPNVFISRVTSMLQFPASHDVNYSCPIKQPVVETPLPRVKLNRTDFNIGNWKSPLQWKKKWWATGPSPSLSWSLRWRPERKCRILGVKT